MDERFIGPNAVWASLAQACMIAIAYTAACLAAAIFSAFAVLHVDLATVYTDWHVAVDTIVFVASASTAALIGAFWASAAAIAITEMMKLRGPIVYVLAGCGIGLIAALPIVDFLSGEVYETVSNAVVQLSVASGAIGGFVYWLIAGRTAGRWLELPWFDEPRP